MTDCKNAAGGNVTDGVRTIDLTEVEKDFSRAKVIADESGSAVIFENGKPRYLLVDILSNADERLTHEETVDLVAKRVLEKHRKAFEQLAK